MKIVHNIHEAETVKDMKEIFQNVERPVNNNGIPRPVWSRKMKSSSIDCSVNVQLE
jgi:hypothetical protein